MSVALAVERSAVVKPESFRHGFETRLAVGLILSVALHYALFTFFPTFHAAELEFRGTEIAAINLPPALEVPPPPEMIARPAAPKVAAVELDEDVTIAPTTFEANPVENLGPPPKPAATERPRENQPSFIPYDTPPRLRNPDEIRELLRRSYPEALRMAGIEGTVVLWIHIDAAGTVIGARVNQSSGYPLMDQAALAVSHQMSFTPAKNRDKRTPVWVQQALVFELVG